MPSPGVGALPDAQALQHRDESRPRHSFRRGGPRAWCPESPACADAGSAPRPAPVARANSPPRRRFQSSGSSSRRFSSKFGLWKRGMPRRRSPSTQLGRTAQLAGQDSPAQRAECHERRADAPAFLEHRDFGIARPQRVFGLQRRDGMHGVRAAQGRRADLGEPDRANLACADQVRHRADRVLDGNLACPSDAGSRDRCDRSCRLRSDCSQTARMASGLPSITRLPSRPNSPHLLATMTLSGRVPRSRADQLLVGAEAVQRRGIEMRDAQIERAADHALGDVARLRRPVAHATGSCSRSRWR